MTNEKHRAFIRQLPCIIPGCNDGVTVECAHVRYASAMAAKTEMGMQRRDDRWVLPLCGRHHREQHMGSERSFWTKMGVDPIPLCAFLWSASGDYERGVKIVYGVTKHAQQAS